MKGEKLHTAHLLLGGNIGDVSSCLNEAIHRIDQKCGKITRRSRTFRSEPWGMEDAHWFINMAVELETHLGPEVLLDELINIEHGLGRSREKETSNLYQSRTVDIDILYFDQLVYQSKSLSIPHPRLHLRRFALTCMADLDADWVHPKLMKTQTELLSACEDIGKVEMT